ncbi:MAG: DUF1127 domain-containing protein [Alphaproteobacteria bacterium]|nr:DUF1127 domain-containing protein [Alphaproteobacteria bacterium]
MAYLSDPRRPVSSIAGLFARAEAAFELYLRRRAARNEVLRELDAMSDRDLNDLGLSRADIDRIADEVAAQV